MYVEVFWKASNAICVRGSGDVGISGGPRVGVWQFSEKAYQFRACRTKVLWKVAWRDDSSWDWFCSQIILENIMYNTSTFQNLKGT